MTHTYTTPINSLLTDIYGTETAAEFIESFGDLIAKHRCTQAQSPLPVVQARSWLIAYPDHLTNTENSPLSVLGDFVDERLRPQISGVHVLPCFPSSSDGGFSVMDYTAIDSRNGTWGDVEDLGNAGDLMLDAVINHASVQGKWFLEWQRGNPAFTDFFRTEDPEADLSSVVRAREHPLLTRFDTAMGERWVWTTFSADQADLNYQNPSVLLSVCAVLLSYAEHRASAIRLDAVGFLWKEVGTASIHLTETHKIVQLIRAVLDETYPNVLLVTETNVPHDENVLYLGDGFTREADMVYQFPLPPLTLHAFWKGDGSVLRSWLETTRDIPPRTTYLNFLASHDGIGLRPLEGLVEQADVNGLVDACRRNGGMVTYRSGSNGVPVAYELNATWFDLIRGSEVGDLAMARHVASHALMLALRGEPAIYFQSLLAERNSVELASSDQARLINRHKFSITDVDACLDDRSSAAAQSLSALLKMLTWRSQSGAFDPAASQTTINTARSVIGIERHSPTGSKARVFINLSAEQTVVDNDLAGEVRGFSAAPLGHQIELGPYGVAWINSSDILDS